MRGEILSLETVQKISNLEKKLLRAERDKNLAQMELKVSEKNNSKIMQEVEYLRKRDKTFTAVENSIPQWIENLKKNNAPLPVIKEIEYLGNMLSEEKEKLLKNSEVEDEEI